MKFTVITVCKNAARTIERTMRSVAEQTYPNVEYLVLDGASGDGTQAIVERHRRHITRFTSEPDGGIYPAMNKGVRAATGDYLYFLNADDYLADPNVLGDVAGFLEGHSGCDLVYGDMNVVRRSGNVIPIELPPADKALEYLITGCLPHQGSFARARLFESVGLFNEGYRCAADYEWFLRVLQRTGVEVRYFPRRIAYFTEGGTSTTQTTLSGTEMFEIQNRAPVYKTPEWQQRCIHRYQHAILYYREILSVGAQDDLVEQIRDLTEQLRLARKKIAYMQGSKFWKLRHWYLKIRGLVDQRCRNPSLILAPVK